MGGSDEPHNIVELSVCEHAEEHRKLFEKYGKREDYVAWKALSGSIGREELNRMLMSLGGIKQGRINSDNGHMANIQKLGASIGGKRSSEVCREKRVNAFFDDTIRNKICSLGGKTQGLKNSKSGHLKRIAQLPNKRTSGRIWITDGYSNKMIKRESEIPDGWRKGKTQKAKI